MFRNYLKIAVRNLSRNKGSSLINIFGLTVGITVTILIFLYVQFEFSYDKFHNDTENLYRVSIIHNAEGKMELDSPQFTPPIGPAMVKEFPEVKSFVRIRTPRSEYISYNNIAKKIDNVCYADSNFFSIFSFELIAGQKDRALVDPYSIVLTQETANILFGSMNPINKLVKIGDDLYKITGIAKDPPTNSHIQFKSLISFSTLYKNPDLYLDWNGGNQYITYVKLFENASAQDVNKKFPEFMWEPINKMIAEVGSRLEPYLQSFDDIHLYHNGYSESLRRNIYIFSFLALFILIIACINFINTTTAFASRRAKEVGVRKVLGANKKLLVKQFLWETAILVFISFLIALILVEVLLPFYNNLVNRDIEFQIFSNLYLLLGLFCILIITGIISGSYPAFYLSSFKPVKTLKGITSFRSKKLNLRNVLVVFQFTISIALIICTLIINNQQKFLHTKNLGFNKENILTIPLNSSELRSKYNILKEELYKAPGIQSVTASSEIPYNGFTSNGYIPEGMNTSMIIHAVDVDEDFLQTYGIGIVEGDNFSKIASTDAFLINESLVRTLGWEQPIGKIIQRNGNHKVIGVIKDFHFAKLHNKIEPLIITNRPWFNQFDIVSVKISANNIPGILNSIERIWREFDPAIPFEYSFLDEEFDHLYKEEQRFGEIFFYSSFLAIIIALMGLFSLISFVTEQRTKEIGIRKVLGSTVSGIVHLFSKDYLKCVLWANLIAWPVAWYVMNNWLQNFAYHIRIEIWVFAVAGVIALICAVITVCWQVIKAATANPVESLRYE